MENRVILDVKQKKKNILTDILKTKKTINRKN